jgi:hypothetical protein
MRAPHRRVLVVAVSLLALASPALAQSSRSWPDKTRVSVNFGLQPSGGSFDTTATQTAYLEEAVFESSAKIGSGTIFDGGVAIHLSRGLGVGLAVSTFGQKTNASVAGEVPHPFFYNTMRTLGGTVGLERGETAAHVQVVYVVPVKRNIDVALAAGPSVFNVSQDLVVDVAYSEDYPYDSADFSSATVSRARKSQIGFNAGADVALHLSPRFGVGVLLRYSHASLKLTGANGVSVTVGAGGLQFGGGLRIFF